MIGVVAGLALLAIAVWFLLRRRRRSHSHVAEEHHEPGIYEKEAPNPSELPGDRDVAESGGYGLYEVESRPSELEGGRPELGPSSPVADSPLKHVETVETEEQGYR